MDGFDHVLHIFRPSLARPGRAFSRWPSESLAAIAVVLDAKGRASFSALQADLAGGGKSALLHAFDCLFLDGRGLRGLPLSERRKALEELIGRPKSGRHAVQ
jgi:hypothetical protein